MRRPVYLMFVIISLVLCSCQHKELCYDHSHTIYAKISFDWTKAPEASPETMSLYLFSEDGTDPQRYEFVGRDGGTIRVVPGVYQAICLNSDTEVICHRNTEHFSTYMLTTEPVGLLNGMVSAGGAVSSPPKVKGAEDQKVISPIEKLWCHQMPNMNIAEGMESHTFTPDSAYCHIILEIRNVENLHQVYSVSGALSGMADGYLIGLGELSPGLAIVPFAIKISGQNDELKADFYTFGHCSHKLSDHVLSIYVIMKDGSKWSYNIDVTDKMHHRDDSNVIRITLEQLPIPEIKPDNPNGGGGGGGFVPEVEDWNTVYIKINM